MYDYKERIGIIADALSKGFPDSKMRTAATDMLIDAINRCVDYVASVAVMEGTLPILRFTKEGQEYRDAVAELDTRRRNCHEAAIAALSALSRLCSRVDAPLLFEGNLVSRYEVADFCHDFVNKLFAGRTAKSGAALLAELAYEKEQS